MRLLSKTLIAVMIISALGFSQEPLAQITLPPIERKAFLNGMQLLFFDSEEERSTFAMVISNGAAFDPVEKWGVTYLMAHMLLQGLGERNYLDEFRTRSIEVECRVDWDAIYIIGSAPRNELEFALLTLAEVLVRPEFREESFQQLRSQLIEEVRGEETQPESMTQQTFESRIFQENPYGHPVKGTVETLENLFVQDVKIQARRLLLPNQTRLALYYSGDREYLFRRLSRRWGAWVRSDPAPFTFRRSSNPDRPQVVVLRREGQAGSLLRWGYLGVSKADPEYFVFRVLEQYLTLSMPDWAKEIENSDHIKGYTRMAARRMPGFLQVNIETSPTSAARYLARLQSTVQDLAQGRIDENRFAEAKSLVLQDFLSVLADPLGQLLEFAAADAHGLGVSFIPTFSLRLERVTPEIFQKTLAQSLPPTGFIAVLSDVPSEIESELGQFGQVEVLN